jgi:hypothetical protein
MRVPIARKKRGGQFPRHGQGAGTDRLALVRERQLVDLIGDLDETRDVLLGRALGGDNEAYALAQVVKAAADFVVDIRERQNNGGGT